MAYENIIKKSVSLVGTIANSGCLCVDETMYVCGVSNFFSGILCFKYGCIGSGTWLLPPNPSAPCDVIIGNAGPSKWGYIDKITTNGICCIGGSIDCGYFTGLEACCSEFMCYIDFCSNSYSTMGAASGTCISCYCGISSISPGTLSLVCESNIVGR